MLVLASAGVGKVGQDDSRWVPGLVQLSSLQSVLGFCSKLSTGAVDCLAWVCESWGQRIGWGSGLGMLKHSLDGSRRVYFLFRPI